MSGSDYNLFWTETVRQLIEEGNLSEQEHDMWFRNMEFIKGSSDSITLGVPSNFFRDQVKQRYLKLLESRLHDLTGSSLTIDFEIRKNNRQAQEKSVKTQIQTALNIDLVFIFYFPFYLLIETSFNASGTSPELTIIFPLGLLFHSNIYI